MIDDALEKIFEEKAHPLGNFTVVRITNQSVDFINNNYLTGFISMGTKKSCPKVHEQNVLK